YQYTHITYIMTRQHSSTTPIPYTTLFRSFILVNAAFGLLPITLAIAGHSLLLIVIGAVVLVGAVGAELDFKKGGISKPTAPTSRSEEHTSELQSLRHLVCRLLLEKKNQNI